MYRYGNETFFKPALEDVVYHIQSSKKKNVVWKFDTSSKKINISANEIEPKNRGKSITISQVKETSKYLFILYSLEQNIYLGMYDKSNNKFNNVIIKDDLAGGFDFIHAGKCNDNQLMSVLLASRTKKLKRYEKASLSIRKKELDNILNNINEEDNPLVVVVKLK